MAVVLASEMRGRLDLLNLRQGPAGRKARALALFVSPVGRHRGATTSHAHGIRVAIRRGGLRGSQCRVGRWDDLHK